MTEVLEIRIKAVLPLYSHGAMVVCEPRYEGQSSILGGKH